MTTPATKKPKRPSWLRWAPQPLADGVLAEQMHNLVYGLLSGDQISVLPLNHDGSPTKVDENGNTKQGMRDLLGFIPHFKTISQTFSYPKGRLALFASRRAIIQKKGKARPIDIPSEQKRFDQLAMLVFNLIPLVVEKDALDPRVVGFRALVEFDKFTKRKDGVTIQDVFADTMLILIREYGPFVLLIDLKDAYGNLPHVAINLALEELLGLNRQDRRRIIESARIRTRLPNGKLLKPKGFGIEQGSPIAPLLFNLVQTLIARRLRAFGFESGCFGDDIGIATTTKAEAERAFEVYKKTLGSLGFNLAKLRPLGDPDVTKKASFIYDARKQQLPLISTYLMTIAENGLNADKEADLISRLPKNPSFNQVCRANRWKMVSNSYLRRVWMTLQSPAETQQVMGNPSTALQQSPLILNRDPGDVALKATEPDGVRGEPYPFAKDQDTEMPSSVDMEPGKITSCSQGDDEDTASKQQSSTLYPYSMDEVTITVTSSSLEKSALASGKTASTGQEGVQAGTPTGGRMSVLRDGSEAGLTLSENEAEEDGHPSSASTPVFISLKVEDADALAEGRRLRVGDNYRPPPAGKKEEKNQGTKGRVVLDVGGAGDRVPESRRAGAVRQLVRAASNLGRADLLVHPGGKWLHHLLALDGDDGFRIRVREVPQGVVVTVWKLVADATTVSAKVEMPPAAEVVIDRLRRSTEDRLLWRVRARTTGGVEHRTFRVRCFDATIGTIEVLAQAMTTWPSHTVAFPAFGQVHRLLGGKVRARQVDLYQAVESLKSTSFRMVSPGWMLGIPSARS